MLIFLFGLLVFDSISQDYHHWSEQFGARASFLGGAATAGLGDNATVYYNAASMAFVEHPSLSISVNAYRFTNTKLKNALGEGFDLENNQFTTMPNLIAGIYTAKKNSKFRFGYAMITRRNYHSKYDHLFQGLREVQSSTVGPESFVGSYNQNHQLLEYWAGIAMSYQVTPYMSLGLAHFGIYRNVKYSNANEFSALPTDGSTGDVASFTSRISFNYWNVKGVFKPSIAFSLEKFKFGISYTTPSFNMMGKADVSRDFSVINMDELIATDLKVVDRAENLKVTHKEFGSLAIGFSVRMGKKTWLHWTNETYFGGKYYLIFDTDQSPSTYPNGISDEDLTEFFGDQHFLAFGEETVSRTNIGLGIEIAIHKDWQLYLGGRTDFMFNERPYFNYKQIGIDASKWNLYHASIGFAYTTKKMKRFSAGFEFGFTPERKYHHTINYHDPTQANLFVGQGGDNASAKVFSSKFILQIDILSPKNRSGDTTNVN